VMKRPLSPMLASGVVLFVVSLFLVSSPLSAHHASGIYDRDHLVTVSGTVSKYMFTNPHVLIYVDVKDDQGNVETWIAESASPLRLARVGWNTKTLKAGDEITVTGAPVKTGRKIMSIVKVTGQNIPSLTQGAE